MKFSWRDILFTLVSGFVVQKVVDGSGMDIFHSIKSMREKRLAAMKGQVPAEGTPSSPEVQEVVLPERFGPHPYAIYYERVVWSLTKDFNLPKVRKVRNFLNQHEDFMEMSYHNKTPPEHVARITQAVLDGKMPLPAREDPKTVFMTRAERVLGPKLARAAAGLPEQPPPPAPVEPQNPSEEG